MLEQIAQRGCNLTKDIEEQSEHHLIWPDASTSDPFQLYKFYDSVI